MLRVFTMVYAASLLLVAMYITSAKCEVSATYNAVEKKI